MTFEKELQQLISTLQNGSLTPESFPVSAKNAVKLRDFSNFTRRDILSYLSRPLTPQKYGALHFGRFNLTLHWQKEFSIQIYFMDDISTEIHTHAFYGYYQYLEGTSHQTLFNEKTVPQTGLQAAAFEFDSEKLYQTGDSQIVTPGYLHQVMRVDRKNTVLMCMHHEFKPMVDRYYLPTGHALFNPPELSDKFLRITSLMLIEPEMTQNLMKEITAEEALIYLCRNNYLDKNVPEVLGDLLKQKINELISFEELKEAFAKMDRKQKKLTFLA
jgi:hypothetical protein